MESSIKIKVLIVGQIGRLGEVGNTPIMGDWSKTREDVVQRGTSKLDHWLDESGESGVRVPVSDGKGGHRIEFAIDETG